MLILKRVEIQGFKSFCDRTEMRFPGKGIAAIVGPNGCGKSNLSDAISWVLGEQSAKSLRGARMEDVIFAGTRDRKPLGMAQVTMVLVDPTGRTVVPGKPSGVNPATTTAASATPAPEPAPAGEPSNAPDAPIEIIEAPKTPNGQPNGGFSLHAPGKEQEITITRRLYRSGESEYLINGRTARLRDIQELFMGTGLGPESYAIIEQGRIGQILSSKPLDRRAVIEEACGISKFKNKRRLAEAKLEGAKQNLTRVFDILEEVSRQVNSLKRQAGKARRYEELKSELDTQLRIALTGRYLILQREAERVAAEMKEASRLYQELHTRVAEEERSLSAAREAFYQIEANLTEARKRLAEVRIEAERTNGQIDSQARQVGSIDQRLQQGETETIEIGTRLEALEQERTNLAAQLEELQKQSADARERLAAKQEEKDVLQNQLRERERTLEQSRQQVVRLLGEASSLKNQLAQIDSYLASIERDTARVRKDEETAQADLARLEQSKTEFAQKLSSRQLELESIQDRRQRVDEELHAHRASASETRKQLDTLKTETSRLRARRDSLEEILSHRAYTTESVKRLFTAVERGQTDSFKPAGVLADFVDLTHPQFEKATEEFLHEELEYVVVKSWDDAQRGIDVLRGDLDGRATFLVEPHLNSDSSTVVSSPVHEPAIGPETGIVGRLSDGIHFTNGLTNAPAALLPRLARCFLAESRDAAQRLSTVYPDLFFLLSDGVCYHGHAVSGGKKTGTGPLALKRELREISGLFQDRHTALAAAQISLEQLEVEIQTLTESLEQLRAEQQRQEKETLVLDQEMRKISEEFNRSNQRLSVSRLELERLTRDEARSREERERKALTVEEKDQQRAQVEQALEQGRAELEALKQEVNTLAEEHSVLRVELAGFEERRRGVDSAGQRLENQIREVVNRRQNLTAEMERLALNRNRLLELNLQLEERATTLADEQAHFEKTVTALAESEAEQRATMLSGEESIKATRSASAEAQEKRSQIELELVRRQSELKFLDETCRKDLNIPVAELASAASGSEGAVDPEASRILELHPDALALDDEALSTLIAKALSPAVPDVPAEGIAAVLAALRETPSSDPEVLAVATLIRDNHADASTLDDEALTALIAEALAPAKAEVSTERIADVLAALRATLIRQQHPDALALDDESLSALIAEALSPAKVEVPVERIAAVLAALRATRIREQHPDALTLDDESLSPLIAEALAPAKANVPAERIAAVLAALRETATDPAVARILELHPDALTQDDESLSALIEEALAPAKADVPAERIAAVVAALRVTPGDPEALAVATLIRDNHADALNRDDHALSALIAEVLHGRAIAQAIVAACQLERTLADTVIDSLQSRGLLSSPEFDPLAAAEAIAETLRAADPARENIDDVALSIAEALSANPEVPVVAVAQLLNLPGPDAIIAATLQASDPDRTNVEDLSHVIAEALSAGPESPVATVAQILGVPDTAPIDPARITAILQALRAYSPTAASGRELVALDELSVADAEEKVSDIRRRIEALGPVNPEALAEFQEAQQRYDFLNTQRQDLLDSIKDTEKAIYEIDTESRKRFTEAFGVINENFKHMFRTLFGGGLGEMRLTGEGDALEQGIEIVASPPGKRLQNVLLLSGGEKALTAVSLLMAIFQYQPSPFCILDEVDAPLDEANVGRLSNLLKDMSAQTQFIVITHAKKTMESAEMLYGVTMQEQGVSKLVSVRLQAPPPPPQLPLQTAARA